jgi:ABC-type Fe3+-siderophore transport system permease subunit
MKPHSLLRRRWPAMLLLLALTIGVFGLGLLTGTYDFSLAEVWQILWGKEVESAEVILDIRLPRVLLAFFTGVILAQGGFFMQALIKNPLADPYIMGLTAGAGFGVNLMILGFLPLAGLAAISYPLSAGLGGLLSLLLVMLLGFRSFQQDNAKLLIAGVAVSAIFSALTGFFIYSFAESDQVRRIVFWTFGSFGRARWEGVWVSGLLLLVSSLFGWMFARRMDVMLLGDRQAHSLGLGVRVQQDCFVAGFGSHRRRHGSLYRTHWFCGHDDPALQPGALWQQPPPQPPAGRTAGRSLFAQLRCAQPVAPAARRLAGRDYYRYSGGAFFPLCTLLQRQLPINKNDNFSPSNGLKLLQK